MKLLRNELLLSEIDGKYWIPSTPKVPNSSKYNVTVRKPSVEVSTELHKEIRFSRNSLYFETFIYPVQMEANKTWEVQSSTGRFFVVNEKSKSYGSYPVE
ncbi:hypothetical protein RUM43_002109 [Polyplax serrata]|uniref:Uncharacterized protein n=1 Tax=Polyplax serrata TaxID=468196 RepID=A0AAN8S4G1_POLSC